MKYRQLFAKPSAVERRSSYDCVELPDGIAPTTDARTRRSATSARRRSASLSPAPISTSSQSGQTDRDFPVEFDGQDVHARQRTAGRRTRTGMERLATAPARVPAAERLCATCATSTTSRVADSRTSGTDTAHGGFGDDKIYVVQTEHQGHRAMHADVHRPGRPRARPDMWLRHDRVRRRAVGAALDHDRYFARRAGARAPAAHGRAIPLVPARRLRRGPREGAGAHRASRSRGSEFADDIRHGFVYERVQHITLKSIANNPDIKEGMPRARSTRRSSGTPTSSCSTTSRSRTRRRSASPARSRSSR